MVTFGIARPSAFSCLRCRLRHVLHHNRNRTNVLRELLRSGRERTFSIHRHLSQESESILKTRHDRDNRGIQGETPELWRHGRIKRGAAGRVIGKAGKRQLVASQQLSATSMGRPAEIVVLRDMKDEKPESHVQLPPLEKRPYEKEEKEKQPISAREIEDEIIGKYRIPFQSEVNESIDKLRPDNIFLSTKELGDLKLILSQAYSAQQLARYVAARLEPSAAAPDSRKHHRSGQVGTEWQAGQTPLSMRLPRYLKQRKKLPAVEQVVQLVWRLAEQSELRQSGELELKLLPWQISMLFDITTNSKPHYESLLSPARLLRSCQIQAYPPDDVVRINGSQADAEQVEQQILSFFSQVKREELDLTGYIGMRPSGNVPESLNGLPSAKHLRLVSDLTKCIVGGGSGHQMCIYGRDESARRNARRMLLSYLDIPFSVSIYTDLSAFPMGLGTNNTVPSGQLSCGLHLRHRDKELVRHAMPLEREHLTQSLDNADRNGSHEQTNIKVPAESILKTPTFMDALHTSVRKETQNLNLQSNHRSYQAASYWHGDVQGGLWEIDFCRLLREPKESAPNETSLANAEKAAKIKTSSAPMALSTIPVDFKGDPVIVQHAVPGVEGLLSYLTLSEMPSTRSNSESPEGALPRKNSSHPYLDAYFLPAPSALMLEPQLPRLRMRFELWSLGGVPQVEMKSLTCMCSLQHIHVPLPGEAVDLRFNHEMEMEAKHDLALEDKRIKEFCNKLRNSVQAKQGALDGPDTIIFRLPRFLVPDISKAAKAKERKKKTKNGRKISTGEDVEVSYFLEGFRQTQSFEFELPADMESLPGLDADVQSDLADAAPQFSLEYIESEGGAMHGSQTLLKLRPKRGVTVKPNGEHDKSDLEASGKVVSQPPAPESDHSHDAVSKGGGLADDRHHGDSDTAHKGSLRMEQLTRASTDRREEDEFAPIAGVERAADGAQADSMLATVGLHLARVLTLAHTGKLRRRTVEEQPR